jgi:hypothetical protein
MCTQWPGSDLKTTTNKPLSTFAKVWKKQPAYKGKVLREVYTCEHYTGKRVRVAQGL